MPAISENEADVRRIMTEEKAQLEAILTSLGVGLLVVDAQGAVVSWNDEYVRMFGEPAQDLPAVDLTGNHLPPDAQPRRRASRGENFRTEFVIDGADGTRRWFEAIGIPLQQPEGGEQGSGGVLTIRESSDRSIRQLQDQLLATAAHELRTPLTSITGFLQLIQREMASGNAPDANHLQVAIDQTRRLRALVDDLTDVSLFQSGKLNLRFQELDLCDLVHRTVEALRPATEQTIDFAVPERSILVGGDAIRLQQVIANLVNNALAHGGTDRPVQVRVDESGGRAVVQVRDFGQGIPASDLPNLFLRFYQSGEERGGGLGLGLFIARELVVAHRGSIEVASVEGQGATFTVKLPLWQKAEKPA